MRIRIFLIFLLIAVGIQCQAQYTPAPCRVKSDRATGVVQFVPLATPWLLKAAGAETRSGWGRMATSQSIATLIMAGTVKGLKEVITTRRPDGSDYASFPSGHSAWAFMGATMAARELAWKSPWYAMGAYAVASGVAMERVIDSHHYPTDVIAGATIGILAANLGYWIGDLIFRDRQIRHYDMSDITEGNTPYLSLHTGLHIPIGNIRAGGLRIRRLPALSTYLQGGVPLDTRFGLSAQIGLMSIPIKIESEESCSNVGPLNSVAVSVSPYYIYDVNDIVSLTASAGVGYRYNLNPKVMTGILKSERSTPTGNIGAGVFIMLSRGITASFSAGYEISHYGFSVSESSESGVAGLSRSHGTSSAITTDIGLRIGF